MFIGKYSDNLTTSYITTLSSFATSSCRNGANLGAIGATSSSCVRCSQTVKGTTCYDSKGNPLGATKSSVMASGQAVPSTKPQTVTASIKNPFQVVSGSARIGAGAGSSANSSVGPRVTSTGSSAGIGAGAGVGTSIKTGLESLPEAVQEAIDPIVNVYEDVGNKIEAAGLPSWLLPAGIIGLGAILALIIFKK